MGASLVTVALVRWAHVSDTAFRVLVRMAVTALDEPQRGKPAATYFGGRDLLVMTLRSDKGSLQSRYRLIRRALAELAEVGAIEHVQSGRSGQYAIYRLTLGALEKGRSNPPAKPKKGGRTSPPETGAEGGHSSPPEEGRVSPPQEGPTVPLRGVAVTPPRNKEEPLEELKEEEGVQVAPTSYPPRVPAPGTGNVIPFVSKKPDPDMERRTRSRVAGVAALAASAEKVRTRAADIQARIDSRKETS